MRERILLSGPGWELVRAPARPEGSTELPTGAEPVGTVEVPGNLQVQLGFEDLWLDSPELTTLNHHEWLYTRRFPSPGRPAGGRVFLAFDGVDYFSEVWLNGHHVGSHEGAFSTWRLDVTDALAPNGGENELVLGVSCPWRVDSRAFFLQPSTTFSVVLKNSEYLKGNLLHYWDGLPMSGNAVFPFGPWRDVWLEVRAGAVLERLSASTVRLAAGEAELELHCEWWSEQGGEVSVDFLIEPDNFEGETQRLAASFTLTLGTSETSTRATVADPALWWTWDTGPQNLYRARAATSEGDEVESVFGIRQLARDEETLAYSINGTRLFLRGVWYPFANIFNAVPTAEEHRRDAEMLREGNSNHLVAFTLVEKDAFYEACDREGILVFQELPFHQLGPMQVIDPSYPRFEEYRRFALAEVENVVRQLRGHASVVLWAAFAETRKAGRWVWGDYSAFTEEIERIVRDGDPDAVFHPSFCDFEEEHIWNGGFPFGEFSDHYDRNHRFISEFGAIAPPVVETLREIVPPEAIWGVEAGSEGRVALPIDAEEYSYRWSFDYAGLCTSVARMFRHADRDPPTLERFVDAIQWYQAFGLRYCAEVYRRKRFADIAGCRTWSYRENVPGIKFTVVDQHQRPKIGYFGLRAGYAPMLLSLDDREPLRPRAAGSRYVHDLWLVNDTPRAERLDVRARLLDVGGRELRTLERRVDAPPDSGSPALALDLALPEEPGAYLLRYDATRPDGSTATTGDTWIRVVRPAFDPALRVLLVGQSRYAAPIAESLAGAGGIELTIVDETTRRPRDSSWSEGLAGGVDVVWLAGWDYAAHQFRAREWENVAAAVRDGVGFVHTGGQASFHGGDGRGALLDCTALGEVLPVSLRPHDGAWDREPPIRRLPGCAPVFTAELGEMPFRGFSRTEPRPGSDVHWTIGEFPLLVTGRYGNGATVAFTGSFTKPLRMFRIGEGLDWEDPIDVQPHWARQDIKAYGPYWQGILELSLGLLAAAARRGPVAPPAELADELRRPLFEHLAELPRTELRCAIDGGVAVVENAGATVARLVRGRVLAETNDVRFRDGFADLLPGEVARLRFEAAGEIRGVAVSAQNAAPVEVTI